jgi:hypothetical protein
MVSARAPCHLPTPPHMHWHDCLQAQQRLTHIYKDNDKYIGRDMNKPSVSTFVDKEMEGTAYSDRDWTPCMIRLVNRGRR